MTFSFRPAKRENVSLIVALAGGTGSGKTYSALELATGLAGGKRFCVIDTEAGRAAHYADRFEFDHGDLRPPFRPDAYAEAIAAADAAGYPVIVVDSASHEHAGEGGLLDWHDEILDRITKGNDSRREACTMLAWVEPKQSHKRFVGRLLQCRAHLILCLRAEPKIEMAREDGKMVVREKRGPTGAHGWFPVCEKSLPYEATTSLLLLAERPGVPIPIKLQEQHRAFFPLDRPITRAAGGGLAGWAGGATKAEASPKSNGKTAPLLAGILTRILASTSEDSLATVVADASLLVGQAKAKAQSAYKARRAAIRAAAREPEREG